MKTKTLLANGDRAMASLVLPALLLTGCQTVEDYSLSYRLWKNNDMQRTCEPAPNANLKVFERKDCRDSLIEYDEISESVDGVRRRAYFLGANVGRIATGKKPVFVPPSTSTSMSQVPVVNVRSIATNLTTSPCSRLIVVQDARGFSLHHDSEVDGPYNLPNYVESNGNVTRVVLTPLAVAGDAVMVGVVAGVVCFMNWVAPGAQVDPYR